MRGGKSTTFLLLAFFEIPSAQDIQGANMPYFREVCSEPYHRSIKRKRINLIRTEIYCFEEEFQVRVSKKFCVGIDYYAGQQCTWNPAGGEWVNEVNLLVGVWSVYPGNVSPFGYPLLFGLGAESTFLYHNFGCYRRERDALHRSPNC